MMLCCVCMRSEAPLLHVALRLRFDLVVLHVQAALFFVALGNEKKLLALAKADSGFLMQRKLSGAEGNINSSSGRGKAWWLRLTTIMY